jgi:hypothetical protein
LGTGTAQEDAAFGFELSERNSTNDDDWKISLFENRIFTKVHPKPKYMRIYILSSFFLCIVLPR